MDIWAFVLLSGKSKEYRAITPFFHGVVEQLAHSLRRNILPDSRFILSEPVGRLALRIGENTDMRRDEWLNLRGR